MLIDRTHRAWLVGTAFALAAAAVAYVPYQLRAPGGPSGGRPAGLVYGALGLGAMLFAGLLGARKQVPVWRVGRAQTWMRGHLWLGLASLPLILLHAGFAAGGRLTQVALGLLVVVVASGVVGAVLQHYLPRAITARVPLETIYDEIGSVRRQLVEEADRIVEAVASGADRERLRALYLEQVRPFLLAGGPDGGLFARMRGQLPHELHAAVDDLEGICEESRQLGRQIRLHRWLHGWLLIHVPLSLALLVVGVVHAVVALRY